MKSAFLSPILNVLLPGAKGFHHFPADRHKKTLWQGLQGAIGSGIFSTFFRRLQLT
jgi:hypothetical protein